MNPGNGILVPADDTLTTQVEDEIILLCMSEAQPKYFGLRGSAVRMWQLIEEKTYTESSMVAALTREYAVDEATLHADVAATLDGLERRGLIRKR